MNRTIMTFAALFLSAAVFAAVGKTVTQKTDTASDTIVQQQWEYLVVAGTNINLSPSGNPNLRKEPSGAFSREAFVLEQNLDKLGARGWELVSVAGNPSDPTYYFKRRK